ncbi:MAG: extracellular solute-binding protein [Anaerorhabdus sp.]
MKKVLSGLLVLLLVLSATGCSSKDKTTEEVASGKDVVLKLWGSQEDQEFLKERVEAFKATDPDNTYTIELGVVGEPDARDKVLNDLEASADVFAFSNDQLRDLVNADALYEITLHKDQIQNENVLGSVDAVTLNDKIYGYPFSADNGYFMYYNSEFLSADDVLSLDAMVAKAEEQGKKIFFDLSNGWYIASFFLGAGGNLTMDENGKQVCDFNNETGVMVGEYIRKFASSSAFITGDDATFIAGVEDGSIIAGVSGTWNAEKLASAMGDGYAASKLPSITLSNGTEVQLASFGGYKVYGVNTMTKFPEEAMALAAFLSSEESQTLRFEARELGPSNLKSAESDAVKANVALNALALQSVYAHSQKDVVSTFWVPTEAFGTEMENGNTSDMQALLDEMVNQIQQ